MAQSRLVAGGGIFVDNAFAGSPVDNRDRRLQSGFGRGFIRSLTDSFKGRAHSRAKRTVMHIGFGTSGLVLFGSFEFGQFCAPLMKVVKYIGSGERGQGGISEVSLTRLSFVHRSKRRDKASRRGAVMRPEQTGIPHKISPAV